MIHTGFARNPTLIVNSRLRITNPNHYFRAVTVLRLTHSPGFAQGLAALKPALGWTDEQVEKLLAKCVKEGGA